ncbi:MAG: hypothetical protein WCV85_00650 [Patescibacteria group bacterium]
MQRVWFKAKEYGYGWYPATWQGWLILLSYLAVVLGVTFLIFDFRSDQATLGQILWFVGITFVATILLIVICWKTGEKAGWRWGKKR